MVLASLLTVCGLPVSARGNVSDSIIQIQAYLNDGGTPWQSEFRPKWDYTSSYVKNDNASGGSLLCWVNRSHTETNYSDDTVDRYYGYLTYNGASQNAKTVYPNCYYYLPNYVKEDGYEYAGLGYIMNSEGVYYKIYWSPDSI